MFNNNPKLKNIFLLGFLFYLSVAFTSYINSSFLSVFSGEKNVGLIYILGSITAICTLFFIPSILQKIGEYKFLLATSGIASFSLFLLSFLKNPILIIPIFIFYFTLNTLIIFALDELLQIFTKNSSKGKIHGLYLTIINLAWVISQAISGRTIGGFSFSTLYFVAFIIMAIFFLVVFLGLKNLNDPHYDKTLALESFKRFFKNKHLVHAYKINFILQFFYVWMIIYTPIYLSSHLGFSWREISIIFTIMLLPFVLFQYPLGKYSDKIGERKMLMFGFFMASLSTITLFFIKEHAIWIWALILFSSRIGAATIEVMSDVYFFKHIEKENDEFISIYRNAGPMAYVLAPIVAFMAFSFTPSFKYIFLILGTLLLYGVHLASTVKKTDI